MALPSEWTTEALVEEVIASPWRVPPSSPDTREIQRPGWFQRLTPSLPQGALNEVSHCVLAADEADRVIDATIAEYHALGIRFRWAVTPGSKPDDLAERLARRGFTPEEAWGVVRDLSPLALENAAKDVRVIAVDASSIDAFTNVLAPGFDMDPEPLRPLHRAMVGREDSPYRFFLTRVDGVAAGAGVYTVAGRAAYQMGGVVLPAFRRRGLYPALVAARLEDAASRGLSIATSRARPETSGPILLRLGFEVVCRFPVFSIAPPG